MLRSAALILSGNAAGALMTLARNLMVARMITVEHYGIAATFAIAVSIAEMMSNFGLRQQIVQAAEGEDARFQAGLQGFSLLRGLVAGAALFLLARPIADFLNIPDIAWAFQLMALVPVMNALIHFDVERLTRAMRFWPMVLTGTVPQLVALLAIWPLSLWFGDYRIMLYSILAQSALALITSHLVAETPFRVILDRALIRQSVAFGWPMLVNGALLFAVFQGDKLLVGRELGMAVLAIFAMGVTLTLTPTLLMAKSAQSFFLPQLSGAGRSADTAAFDGLARAVVQVGLLNGVLLVAGIVVLGGPLVDLLLGDKYAALKGILTSLAVLMAFRVFKSGSTVVALSRGQTSNAMMANLVRVASLPVVWWVLAQGGGLRDLIVVATLAEVAGFALSLALVSRRLGVALHPVALSLVLSLVFLLLAGAGEWLALAPGLLWPALAVALALLIWSMRDLRLYLGRAGVVSRQT